MHDPRVRGWVAQGGAYQRQLYDSLDDDDGNNVC